MSSPEISLVLACYNEEEILESSFAEVVDTLQSFGRPFEIIFVDDVSRDRTRELIRSLVDSHPELQLQVILHDQNRGRAPP